MESPTAAEVLAAELGVACEVHDVWIDQPPVGDEEERGVGGVPSSRWVPVSRAAANSNANSAATARSFDPPMTIERSGRWRACQC